MGARPTRLAPPGSRPPVVQLSAGSMAKHRAPVDPVSKRGAEPGAVGTARNQSEQLIGRVTRCPSARADGMFGLLPRRTVTGGARRMSRYGRTDEHRHSCDAIEVCGRERAVWPWRSRRPQLVTP